ncbi:MAG: ester cyclase [Deltaproteobacteria bacterium]|nr:MAG: ester cyclase [Deltaproteobacteria bacterium]
MASSAQTLALAVKMYTCVLVILLSLSMGEFVSWKAVNNAFSIPYQTGDSIMNASTQHEHILRRFVSEFINGGDESVLSDLVHQDYVYQSPDDEVVGQDGLAAMFRGFRTAFPDLHLDVQDVIAKEDTTVLDFAFRGTHQGEFMGIPATHRPFNIRGVVISRYKDGKIASEWEILDTANLLRQLGVG